MNTIQTLMNANAAIDTIINKYKGIKPPEEARKVELKKLSKDELIALVLEHEGKANAKPFKVEDLCREIMESPECAIFPYKVIAEKIQAAFPDRKTSEKSLASYASKNDWDVVRRQKISF